MMTVAIRELVATKGWLVDVKTSCPDIWLNNPYLQKMPGYMPTFSIGYTRAINRSSQIQTRHFSQGYLFDINSIFNLNLRISDIRPDVFLSKHEINELPHGLKRPYWVVFAGGKNCYVTKWWDPIYYQRVIDLTKRDIQWIQMGRREHVHFPLDSTINLLDKTTLREALRIIANAEGVLCPLTFAMHAAAAFNRPCVCIAGGREPWWWEAYNEKTWSMNCRTKPPADFVPHRYLHTIGRFDCCKTHGCWRTHMAHEAKDKNCLNQIAGASITQPLCLEVFQPEIVVNEIFSYGRPKRQEIRYILPAWPSNGNIGLETSDSAER